MTATTPSIPISNTPLQGQNTMTQIEMTTIDRVHGALIWEPTGFQVTIGTLSKMTSATVAGHVGGNFALDFRLYDDGYEDYVKGWCVTHLPTGFVCGAVWADLDDAKAIVQRLSDAGDWRSDDRETIQREMAPVHKALRAEFAGKLMSKMAAFQPFWSVAS